MIDQIIVQIPNDSINPKQKCISVCTDHVQQTACYYDMILIIFLWYDIVSLNVSADMIHCTLITG